MTAQIHEGLIIDGKVTSMACCPSFPEEHPRIYELSPDEALRDEGSLFYQCSNCWRGYRGTWEIKNERFYLVRLNGRFQLRGSTPVLADWFSGILRVPMGEILVYVHMGFGSVYEQELHIKVENGVVVMARTIDNHKPRRVCRILSCFLRHAARAVCSFWR